MKYLFTITLLFVGAVVAQQAVVDSLIKRGEELSTKVNTNMVQYRVKNNYFVRALDDELRVLGTILVDLKAERNKTATDLNTAFLNQAEQQLIRHELILAELLTLADKANNDVQYQTILALVDALLARAYEDVGRLVTHGHGDQAKVLQAEIEKVESLEKTLKSINYKSSPEEAQKAVETILAHERVIEEEVYRIERLAPITNP